MKKLNLFSIVLLASLSVNAFAAATTKKPAAATAPAAAQSAPAASQTNYSRPYGMAGCGLGNYVVGKSGSQILAATTNGTAWNQMFGITFGTSNCDDSQNLNKTASRLDNFISGNKVAIASDAAKGEGETVAVLAKLMNCSDSANLGASLQSNFGNIFSRYDLTANEISDNLLTVVINDQNLSQQCKVRI